MSDKLNKLANLKAEGEKYFYSGDFSNAISFYAQYLAENPSDEDVRKKLELCNKKMQEASANTKSQSQDSASPQNGKKKSKTALWVALGVVLALIISGAGLYMSGFFDKTKTRAVEKKDEKKDEKKESNAFAAYVEKGDEQLKEKSFKKARDYYKLAWEIDPNNKQLNEKIKQCNGEMYKKKADDFFQQKAYRRALDNYKALSELFPENETAKQKIKECEDFLQETPARLMKKQGKNGKYGFIDENGNVVVDFIYTEIRAFANDLAPVKRDGRWGFVNKKGKELVKCRYDEVEKAGAAYRAVDNRKNLTHVVSYRNNKLKIKID